MSAPGSGLRDARAYRHAAALGDWSWTALPSAQPDVDRGAQGPPRSARRTPGDAKASLNARQRPGVDRRPRPSSARRPRARVLRRRLIRSRPAGPATDVVAEAVLRLGPPASCLDLAEVHALGWRVSSFRWVRPLHRGVGLVRWVRRSNGTSRIWGRHDNLEPHWTFRTARWAPLPCVRASVRRSSEFCRLSGQAQGRQGRCSTRRAAPGLIAEDAERPWPAKKPRAWPYADDPALLDEVAGLVEWPVVLDGRIDDAFMDLPPEVLTTSMRSRTRSTFDTRMTGRPPGPPLHRRRQHGDRRRRRHDRRRQRAGAARAPGRCALLLGPGPQGHPGRPGAGAGDIVFHAKLGTLATRSRACRAWRSRSPHYLPGADRDRVRSAARLAKADLVTGMVGEFPELQGVMGRYYALGDGEHAEVAEAIAEHYAPQGPSDRCPSAPVSLAVALADKIDTLVGFFAIGQTPTGSKDPFALQARGLGRDSPDRRERRQAAAARGLRARASRIISTLRRSRSARLA